MLENGVQVLENPFGNPEFGEDTDERQLWQILPISSLGSRAPGLTSKTSDAECWLCAHHLLRTCQVASSWLSSYTWLSRLYAAATFWASGMHL